MRFSGSLKTLVSALLLLAAPARAASDTFGVGSGNAGPLTVDAGVQVINSYAVLTADAAAGSARLAVSSITGFSGGMLVMVLQTAGLPAPDSGAPEPIDLTGPGPGQWELARLDAVLPGTLVLTAPLELSFPAKFTQVIAVPEWTSRTSEPMAQPQLRTRASTSPASSKRSTAATPGTRLLNSTASTIAPPPAAARGLGMPHCWRWR